MNMLADAWIHPPRGNLRSNNDPAIEAWLAENTVTKLPDAPAKPKPKPKHKVLEKQRHWRYGNKPINNITMQLVDVIKRDFNHSSELYLDSYVTLIHSLADVKNAFTIVKRELKLKQLKDGNKVIGYRKTKGA